MHEKNPLHEFFDLSSSTYIVSIHGVVVFEATPKKQCHELRQLLEGSYDKACNLEYPGAYTDLLAWGVASAPYLKQTDFDVY